MRIEKRSRREGMGRIDNRRSKGKQPASNASLLGRRIRERRSTRGKRRRSRTGRLRPLPSCASLVGIGLARGPRRVLSTRKYRRRAVGWGRKDAIMGIKGYKLSKTAPNRNTFVVKSSKIIHEKRSILAASIIGTKDDTPNR